MSANSNYHTELSYKNQVISLTYFGYFFHNLSFSRNALFYTVSLYFLLFFHILYIHKLNFQGGFFRATI